MQFPLMQEKEQKAKAVRGIAEAFWKSGLSLELAK
jgi:hypothetical protein